jgi:DNA polymerase elongation subunit (family B)
MTMRVFCDIETLPIEKEYLVNFPKVCNCDDEEYRKLSLTGEYGRVLTIGVIVEADGHVTQCGCLGRDRQTRCFHLQERKTLQAWWKLLQSFSPATDLLITFNGISFDLPFLYKRSIINRVRPTVNLSFARYRSQPLYDVMHEWNKWDPRKHISLDELARILGLTSPKEGGMDGSKVYERFCEGPHTHEQLAEYCMADVRVLRACWYRMMYPEGPEPEAV